MVDVDKLSDNELRSKLLEYGFPVMPITGTTRQVMKKKLKLLIENKKKINSEARRSLGKYSSEEDSEAEEKVKKTDKRRVTIGDALMQPPASKVTQRRTTRIVTEPEPELKSNLKEYTTVTTTTTKKVIKNSHDEFDTGSDSESEIINRQYHSSYGDGDYKRPSPLRSSLTSSYTSSPSPTKPAESIYSRSFTHSSGTPPRTAFMSASDAAEEKLNQIRSRLSLGTPSYESSSYTSALKAEKTETPFLSNFTKRLSQLSPSASDYDYKSDIIKEQDTNGTSYARNYSRPLRSRNSYSYRGNQVSLLKNNLVPVTVLGVIFLFFLVIAIMYLGIRSDTSALEAAGKPNKYLPNN